MSDQPIRTTVSQLTQFLASNLAKNPQPSDIQSALISYATLYSTNALPLTSVQPDFEANKSEFQSLLAQQPAWKDLVVAGTGETILEMIATALTYNQFSIERSVQETMLDTALLNNSILTITRMLGVRISRSSPAACPVTLTLNSPVTGSYSIPAYSVFSLGGIAYFNRSQLTFSSGTTTLNATLYEGSINTLNYISDGTAYQRYLFGNSDFTVSDEDIQITVGAGVWPRTSYTTNYTVGLWEYGPTDFVYFEETTTDGNAQITFGNNLTGAIPPINTTISIVYATTNGSGGNALLTGTAVTVNNYPIVTGVATGPSINGTDPRSAAEYAILAPGAFSAKDKPTRLADYEAYAVQYPGVTDAAFRGQRDIAPNDLNYMMAFEATLLTETQWQQSDWNGFISYIETAGIANSRIIQRTAQQVIFNITANVYCINQTELSTLEQLIQANLTKLTTPRVGCLGYNYYISDIIDAIKNTDIASIPYVTLLAPTRDIVVYPYQYATVGTINLNMQISSR